MAKKKDKNEMTVEELCDLTQGLIDAKKYDEVIDLLDPSILLLKNNSNLFYLKGIACYNKSEFSDAVDEYKMALILDNHNPKIHFNIALAYSNLGEFEAAINHLTIAIELKPDEGIYYAERATTWYYIRGVNNAFDDYSKAIALNPNDETSYYGRGLCWRIRGKLIESIDDFTAAIEINPEYSDAYCDRGISYALLKNYSAAEKDFLSAITYDPLDSKNYYNLGNVYRDISKYDQAKEYYDKTIELSPKASNAYNNRGIILERQKKYDNAIRDFEKALEIYPNHVHARNNLDRVKALIGQKVETDDKDTTSTLQLFISILNAAKVNEDRQKEILKICAETKRDAIDKIRVHAALNIETIIPDNKVAHYTKLKVADILVMKKPSPLRYYNAVYMNDPEEGIVLLGCLDKTVQKCFKNGGAQEEDNIYIGSFLPAYKHQDELVMWRTYGKDENHIEGAGCSVVIDASFFDRYNDGAYINSEITANPNPEISNAPIQCLFRVLYYNKRFKEHREPKFKCENGREIEHDIKTLNSLLNRLIKIKDNPRKSSTPLDNAIDKIIYHIICELRFFFKSADYEFENELRVIQFAGKKSKLLKIDEIPTPKKVYLESNKDVQSHINKIILGPKVPNPKQWLYLDVALKQGDPAYTNISIEPSECKYQ